MHLRVAAFLILASFAIHSAEFQVTRVSTLDENEGLTLPEAVDLANASPDANVRITFDLQGEAPFKIEVSQTLVIARSMVIDGTSQQGYAGTPLIQISRIIAETPAVAAAVAGPFTTSVFEVNDTVINTEVAGDVAAAPGFGVFFSGLSITDGSDFGIYFITGDSHVVESCYIGVAPDGTPAGNFVGIQINSQVSGVRIGTDGNGDGDAVEGNVIGNNFTGISIGSPASGVRVAGNRIGLLPDGSSAANVYGVSATFATNITILNNTLESNDDTGVYLTECSAVEIQGNRIVGNGFGDKTSFRSGIYILGGSSILIGTNGDGIGDAAERNIISGNATRGIFIENNSRVFRAAIEDANPFRVRIAGNYIGVDGDGSALGNGEINDANQDNLAQAGTYDYGGIIVIGMPFVAIGADGNASAGEAGEGNVISSNFGQGIRVTPTDTLDFALAAKPVAGLLEEGDYEYRISGNIIGATPDKTAAAGNGDYGIDFEGYPALIENNLIVDNNLGVYIDESSATIRGNLIGALPSGAAAGNFFPGISVGYTSGVAILNNTVANNDFGGIELYNCDDVVIQGNRIVGNGFGQYFDNDGAGISLYNASSTLVGTNGDGTADADERNIISGNGLYGVLVESGRFGGPQGVAADEVTDFIQVRIAGNYIGVDADGSALPNGTFVREISKARVAARAEGDEEPEGAGVYVFGPTFVVIGSDNNGSAGEANEGNVISSNVGCGIYAGFFSQLPGVQARGLAAAPSLFIYLVQACGNTIGLAPDKVTVRGNTLDGVRVENSGVLVGGTDAGTGNLIANNAGNGVTVLGDSLATILGNSITANTKLGIDLGNDGVTQNDPNQVFPGEGDIPPSVTGDPDSGPNGLANFPVIASISADRKTVTGTLNAEINGSILIAQAEGDPTSTYRVEFFGNPVSSPGQGQRFLGSTEVTLTDLTTYTANFTATLTTPAAPGTSVTATATRFDAGVPFTSEFSIVNQASRVPALLFTSDPIFTPANPTTSDLVTFSAQPNLPGITVTWDFADGSATANGETVTHTYAAPGVYNVLVTLLDAPTGVSISKTLVVTVTAPATPPDAPPTKTSLADFRVRALNITLDTNAGRDTIIVNGLISLPKDFVLNGKTFEINIGGVIRSFTLNKRGKAKIGTDTLKFSLPKGKRNQDYSYTISLKKGTFAEILKTNALTKDAAGMPSAISVRAKFNAKEFIRVVPVKFKTKGTKSSTKFGVF